MGGRGLCSGVGSIMETVRELILIISVNKNFILIKTLVSHNMHLPSASCHTVSHLQQQDLLGEKN